jgi:hypothetical protein
MKISTTRLNWGIWLIWLILPFCKLWAQSHINTGAIRVAVTDEAGATLAGAIALTHTDTEPNAPL